MELRTGFKFLDNILQGGFKKGEMTTLICGGNKDGISKINVETKDVDNIVDIIASNWGVDINYALYYKFNDELAIDYFKNSRELLFWKKLHDIFRKNKNQHVEIIGLYMWDVGSDLPEKINDIEIHFQQDADKQRLGRQ